MLCRYFNSGYCSSGVACKFEHEKLPDHPDHFELASFETERFRAPPTVGSANMSGLSSKSTQACIFFLRGRCLKGSDCEYAHLVQDDNISAESSQQGPMHSEPSPDSRSTVMCKFISRPGGCTNNSYPYSHDTGVGADMNQSYETVDDTGYDWDDDFTRDLAGASVKFSEFGQVREIVLPTDYSCARVAGFEQAPTPETVVGIIRDLGFDIGVCDVRVRRPAGADSMALIKVKDPCFAEALSAKLTGQKLGLNAVPVPVTCRRADRKKAYLSWHKVTRSAWMNFGEEVIANRVAQKFNQGRYRPLGFQIRSSVARESRGRTRQGRHTRNPVAWSISLSDVPGDAGVKDLRAAVMLPYDSPRHIEMGPTSYEASDADVSMNIRSRLEQHGQLESFHLAPQSGGKRVKAIARFQTEEDAMSACSLNDARLDILKGGKLTVTLIQSSKFKTKTTIYSASRDLIKKEMLLWKEKHVKLLIYPDDLQRFTTLKLEGSDHEHVAAASRTLDQILAGIVLTQDDTPLWDPRLCGNGLEYRGLQTIEKNLAVVIERDRLKNHLRFHGPIEKSKLAVDQIVIILGAQHSKSYEISLDARQLTWVTHGGVRLFKETLGTNVATLNAVSKTMIINGTEQQYETSLAILNSNKLEGEFSLSETSGAPESDCPICFCDADTPTRLSCEHTYCLSCFEEYCKSVMATSKGEPQIVCQGDGGDCPEVFTISQVREHISSSTLECLLEASFDGYIQRHAQAFRRCPTADCGYIYRSTESSSSKRSQNTCSNCFELICTSCHAAHGNYTCEDYKDIASGGLQAFEELRRQLNIKDCPRCKTHIEKTEGCNHMTCGGCSAHICWVCMAVFDTSGPCYAHMSSEHGGIGLGLERFQY